MNKQLSLTYEFRERLLKIWNQTTATPKELLEALKQWCIEAEATGIKVLKDFAEYIQTYQLKASYL